MDIDTGVDRDKDVSVDVYGDKDWTQTRGGGSWDRERAITVQKHENKHGH